MSKKKIKPISFKEARKQGRATPGHQKKGLVSGPRYRFLNRAEELRPDVFCIEYEVEETVHAIEISSGYDPIGQSQEIVISHGGSSVIVPREFAAVVAQAMGQLGGRHVDNSPFVVQ